MRVHYLQALEADAQEALPSATQARGFLRTYASYLGLDPDTLTQEMESDPTPEPAVESPAVVKEPASPKKTPVAAAPEIPAGDDPGEIFIQIGAKLRKQREILGLSLENVEHHTNLRQHYLKALESGDLDSLPSPVQGRGMLNNYAVFLGMDPDSVLIPYAEGLQGRLSQRKTAASDTRQKGRRRTTIPRPVRRALSNDLLIGGSLIVILVFILVWGAVRIFSLQSQAAPEPTAPSIVDVLLASPTPSPTLNIPTETPPGAGVVLLEPIEEIQTEATVEAPILISGQEDIEIILTATMRTFLRVTVDGEVEFSGRVPRGSVYNYFGEEIVEILTGNGSAIEIIYNGRNEGLMGDYGEVVLWIYTREGFITPTTTITPTPTITPRVTATAPQPDTGTPTPSP